MTGTHRPIDEAYREKMRGVAQGLDDVFNGEKKGNDRTVGFALLIFPFSHGTEPAAFDGSRVNYISNGRREDMILALKEFLARAEGRHPEEQPAGAPGGVQ